MLRNVRIMLLAVSLSACTNVDLLSAKRPVRINGEYCTDQASTYDVPLRILLIIDTSRSMEFNDPEGYRGQAAADLITALSGTDQDVAFAFIGFSTGATKLTDGFESDPAVLTAALNGLNQQEGFTNYLDALGLAKTMINEDLVKVAERIAQAEENGEDTRYLRPQYFVVFLSDGIPRMSGGITQSTDSILFEVEQLMDIPFEALGITVYTAFLGASDDDQRPEAEALLKRMAEEGNGSYFSFEKGEEIDFSIFDFEIKRLFDIKQFLLFNRSVILVGDFILPDSDMDGLADSDEIEIGTDPMVVDSDGDGLGDGFEVRAALDPRQFNYVCDGDAKLDDDNDGLNNCEETFLHFDKDRFDTDGDLFPDGFEFYSGSNPADFSDVEEDLDFDTVNTADEIRQRTDPRSYDKDLHEYYAYSFEMRRNFDFDSGSVCYDYLVDNVSLAYTMQTPEREAGVNEIIVYFIESPEDDAENRFVLYRQVIPVTYREGRKKQLNFDDIPFDRVADQEMKNQ